MKKDNKMPNTMKIKSVTSTNLEDKAQLFAQYFQTVFINSTDDITPSTPIDIIHMNSLKLTLSEFFEGISKLKFDTGPGPDDIPNFFLKNCQYAIATPLFILFDKSLSEGKLPKRWKISKITPIFKNGDRPDVTNYRPISALNSISKLFENLICNYLTPFFKNMTVKEQHVLRKNSGHSDVIYGM